VRLYSLNHETGVTVEKFPQNWVCQTCDRLYQGVQPNGCLCGSTRFGQLPFVGFHDECGAMRAPYVKACPQHKQIKFVRSGTARAEEIRFVCPVCGKVLQKGFGYRNCDCGKGRLTFNVHRAASVYTPRTFVMINPPSTEKVERIRDAGGPPRALEWVLSGLKVATFEELEVTEDSLRASLIKQGIPADVIDKMLVTVKEEGVFDATDSTIDLQGEQLMEAESGAVNIALALADSRLRIKDLEEGIDSDSELLTKYRDDYPRALARVGLEDIEFLDSFPVVTGCFGYTRGGHEPGTSRLVPFRNSKGEYTVYGEVVKTEALFVRMNPELVAQWLVASGYQIGSWDSPRSARSAILRSAVIPRPTEKCTDENPGAQLLSLVHSYSHWFIRQLAIHSGVERNALSEFLVPQHCGFFVYAASRGDFVLGGLQAVFESALDTLLRDLSSLDPRCPLDPGCQRAGGACMACLHLGEPSCRYYNRYLSRKTLGRYNGYLGIAALQD